MAADETPLPRYFVPGKRKNDAPIFQSDADVLVIGTGSDATFRVDDPMAARLHLKVVYENGLFRVEDLGSALGTYVNGLPVDGVLPLNEGDEVVFGVSPQVVTVWFSGGRPGEQPPFEVVEYVPEVHSVRVAD